MGYGAYALGVTAALATVERPEHPPTRDTVPKDLVRQAIDETGLTYRVLAARVGVTEKTIQRWRNGQSGVPAWAWPRLLELIGLPEDWQPRAVKPAEAPKSKPPRKTK